MLLLLFVSFFLCLTKVILNNLHCVPRMTTDIDVMDNSDMSNKQESLSEIQSFYKDATIFLTGATGFMGNLILEKLIR